MIDRLMAEVNKAIQYIQFMINPNDKFVWGLNIIFWYVAWNYFGLKYLFKILWSLAFNIFYFLKTLQVKVKSDANLKDLEQRLNAYFNADVRLEKTKAKKGCLRLQYRDFEELDKFLNILGWEKSEGEEK